MPSTTFHSWSTLMDIKALCGARTIRTVLLLVGVVSVFAILDIQNFVLPSSPIPSLFGKENLSGQDSTGSLIPERKSPSTSTNSNSTSDVDDDLNLGDGQDSDDKFELVFRNGTALNKTKDDHLTVVGNSSSASVSSPDVGETNNKNKKKKKKEQVLMSISDMDQVLAENRASSGSMVPRWHSKVDKQMLYAKMQLENASEVTADQELYGPIYRNLSMFKRSYELMEQMLKVYVYKEGDIPIFHRPLLTGIYCSEGWFMKQMEGNKQFVTDDPTKAHLFYIPFSSRILQSVLYAADSHNHKPLIAHLRNYISLISSKYPFWNRTNGADHFVASCHDWAPSETKQSMGTAIRALCNSDVNIGFEIGKDVTLPQTYVSTKNDHPLHDFGGKPAHNRTILAFFAGKMHGYFRPILVKNWENKDPKMIITGPIARRIIKKTVEKRKTVKTTIYPYKNFMKDSKFCICPRGYEVNSPRVVEAIFYGCIPVLISDNYVPPFFEVLNWSAFSVILPEKDVPRLKELLMGISQSKFMELERGVRAVRRHFLWNTTPLKYDVFHMILHSVWFNRIYQIREE